MRGSFFIRRRAALLFAMEYVDFGEIPYFAECEHIVRALGFSLVELKVLRRSSSVQASAVIAGQGDVGIDDCASVHRVLQARLEALLGTGDLQMQVSSPGIGRVLKNAAEFSRFEGRNVRVWSIPLGAWVEGRVASSSREAVVLLEKEEEKEYPYSEISKAKLLD